MDSFACFTLHRIPPEKSFTLYAPRRKVTLQCKAEKQKKLNLRRRQPAYHAGRRFFLRFLCRISNHLLKSREILNVTLAAWCGNAANRKRTIVLMPLQYLDHFFFFQHAQVPA